MFQEYLNSVEMILNRICTTQAKNLEYGGEMLAKVLEREGFIFVFGCGHSHILAEEGFYRAGGLASVYPILQSEIMLHEGAVKSSALERRADLAQDIFRRYPIAQKDALIVFSNSGINGLSVEMARIARLDKIPTIVVSSSAYLEKPSRHPLGFHLPDVCDISIDTGIPYGDTCYSIQKSSLMMGPVSTIAAVYILNCLLARAVEIAVQRGCYPDVYVSGNTVGGAEKNEKIIAKYRRRIHTL